MEFSLQTQLARSLPLVEGERVLLQQVILNLIVNAIEAMTDIDVEARELKISTETDAEGSVLVTLRDAGPGFDTTNGDGIFDAFHTTKPEGMGMSLAICRSIIEAHGGRIWASANRSRGAVFQFALPSVRDQAVPSKQAGQLPMA